MDGTYFCVQSLMITIIGECRIRIILVTVVNTHKQPLPNGGL